MRLTSIRTSAAVTTAAAAATLALVSGGTANAATVHPMSATGCNNNTCMYIAGNSGGDVLVQAWARNTTFTGHFNLTGPSGFSQVTGLTATWQAGKGTYWSYTIHSTRRGTYCVQGVATSGAAQGNPCEGVS